mmetsp:Transcript_8899/g.14828  ORF Transcript_8899/g.14828 Transcript_8899/m.14828 type:complete len:206 (+) Transcript_8899:134-751(+)|eukprot:CAMPEP_0119016556 /NCGR_PEP_ID=MMETSP1176-20130426/13559_1 /TAXON_ID=265551 /ORGANISM="Synedropsis recta cf, Strain CCMP1620" /LENGTH=205 /DNA_ID=CAMNT_0006970023 /DNA_START=66 /DNA_END=683 /DNA_ORIENTATION=+
MCQPTVSRKRSRTTVSLDCEPAQKVACIRSALPDRMLEQDENDISPQDHVMQIVRSQGIDVEIRESLNMTGFFSEYTPEELASYDSDVLKAIRSQDIEKLREFHESGRPLKCSNSFGESLLHMACRRGFLKVAAFLIHEANVPVRVRDDYGRTILHDAAWTCEPNFELIAMILMECPDLLFMKDRRGDTAISYARKSHWGPGTSF